MKKRALGASYKAADMGEVLAVAGRVVDGDADSWLGEWTAIAGAAWSAAVDARRSGRRVSALAHFRRAATYYATALYRIAHSSEPDRRLNLWRRQRACWEQILELSQVPGERLGIDNQNAALPGFLPCGGGSQKAPSARGGRRRPTRRPPTCGADPGAAAAERGYHWLTFDGPGQQASLFEQRILFRPDWEKVLTPVLEAMLARRDVDADRVAIIGVGQGGYWVTRALAFEHRFAAAVVDPGIVDVLTAWTDRLPRAIRQQLNDHRQSHFDREMHLAELFAPASARTPALPRRAIRPHRRLRFPGSS